MDSTPHLYGSSLVTRPTAPWSPPALDGRIFKHVTLYPMRLWEYTSVRIFVSVRIIMSNPLRSTAQMACANPKPLTYRMFSALKESPGGRWGQKCSRGSAVCSWSAPWRIDREKVSDILVGNKRTKKEGRKSPVLTTV